MADNKLIDKLDNDNIPIFSVSEITKEITELLEDKYSYVKIKGEISGETGNKYPEIYFTLKDEENVISAIIKRNKIPHLKLLPEDGLEVICTGRVTAYTKRDSKFQIDVDFISIEGEGQLLKMKEKLRKKQGVVMVVAHTESTIEVKTIIHLHNTIVEEKISPNIVGYVMGNNWSISKEYNAWCDKNDIKERRQDVIDVSFNYF